ncbi:MAG: hypothetical protein LBU80_02340, partial [Rikenellaceae bacterium]|nr:hypothetical protein [Rikenellaceae bacterium]
PNGCFSLFIVDFQLVIWPFRVAVNFYGRVWHVSNHKNKNKNKETKVGVKFLSLCEIFARQ